MSAGIVAATMGLMVVMAASFYVTLVVLATYHPHSE